MLHVRVFLCDIQTDIGKTIVVLLIPLDCKVEDTTWIQIHIPDDDIQCLEVTETWTLKHLKDYFAIILETLDFYFTLNERVVHKRLEATSMFA